MKVTNDAVKKSNMEEDAGRELSIKRALKENSQNHKNSAVGPFATT